MPLLPGHKHNFQTLRRAVRARDCALLDCELIATGEQVAVICAVHRPPGKDFEFVPLAMLFNDNPYEVVNPPKPSGSGPDSQEERQDG